MKIIYAARFDDKGVSTNTSQGEGFKKLGHEVLLYDFPERGQVLGPAERDIELVELVRHIEPDLVVVAKGTGLDIKVFKQCRLIAPVAYWFPDPLITYNNLEFIEKTKNADYFCCDKQNVLEAARKHNPNSFLVHEGYDADMERPRENKQSLPVSFIGNLYGDRKQKLNTVEASVSVISDAYGEKHSETVSKTKINLNFCTAAGASDRVYKILGAKGFLLTDDWEGRENTFTDGEHLVIFKDTADLNKKIEYYLAHPEERRKISEAGYQEVQKYTRDAWSSQVVRIWEQQKKKGTFHCLRKNVLICGPWVGEFGWELFAWQAYMRQMSKNYDKVVCISRPTSKALYSDYADEFIPYTPEGGLADSFFMHDHKVDHKFLNSVFSQNSDYNVTWLPPRRVGVPPHTHFKEPILFGYTRVSPEYIKFGESVKRGNDIVIHARNRELRQADNWEIENWNQLVTDLKSLGHKVISIGTKKQSSHIKGTKDMRGCDLKETFNILSSAKVAIGPSSGPMHLASLCKCPHIVWSVKTDDKRYEQNWNPHDTPVLFLGEHEWRPPPKYILEKFKEWCLNNEE